MATAAAAARATSRLDRVRLVSRAAPPAAAEAAIVFHQSAPHMVEPAAEPRHKVACKLRIGYATQQHLMKDLPRGGDE